MHVHSHHLSFVIARACETQRLDPAEGDKSRINLPGLEIEETKGIAGYEELSA